MHVNSSVLCVIQAAMLHVGLLQRTLLLLLRSCGREESVQLLHLAAAAAAATACRRLQAGRRGTAA